MRICFVASIFANSYREADKPSHFNTIKEFDYYLFTNLPKDSFKTSWNVINVANQFNDTNIESNIIKSRYPKFMGWKLIKDVLKKDYDVIFYCDGVWVPKDKNYDFWINTGKQIIEHPSGLMAQRHTRTANRPDFDAYAECKSIVQAKKDTNIRMDKTKEFLIKHNFPKRLLMVVNTNFGYNPNNINLTAALSDFWNEYSTYNTSHRDQPLWSYFMWKHNIKPNLSWNCNKYFYETKGKGWSNHKYVK